MIELIEGEPLKFALFTSDHRMHLKSASLESKKIWLKFMKSSIEKHIGDEDKKLRSVSVTNGRARSNAVCTNDSVAQDLSGKVIESSPYLPRRPSSPFSKTRINVSHHSSPPPVSYERVSHVS